jgi:hypothetical protein
MCLPHVDYFLTLGLKSTRNASRGRLDFTPYKLKTPRLYASGTPRNPDFMPRMACITGFYAQTLAGRGGCLPQTLNPTQKKPHPLIFYNYTKSKYHYIKFFKMKKVV